MKVQEAVKRIGVNIETFDHFIHLACANNFLSMCSENTMHVIYIFHYAVMYKKTKNIINVK